jgi:hypothetical protein
MGEMNQTTLDVKLLAEAAPRACVPDTPLGLAAQVLDPAALPAAVGRSLKARADAFRALQSENIDFASRVLDLQLTALRAFSTTEPIEEQVGKPVEIGASAVELCLGYLGRSAAIVQQAAAAPWTDLSNPH